jgi:hypothetical protein
MATFLDRILQIGDFDVDGGPADAAMFMPMVLQLWASDSISKPTAGALFACTVEQQAGLDEVLDTRPASLPARQSWAITQGSILLAGQLQVPGFYSTEELRAALGLDPLPLAPLVGGGGKSKS